MIADDGYFRALRAEEFPHLDRSGLAYLDYTGAAIPAQSQLREYDAMMRGAIFGNPHSAHGPSKRSTAVIDEARARVLRFINADPDVYAVVFTANASAAAKLVGEAFPFSGASRLALSADNHNSINGIREYARRAGARVQTLPLDDELRLADPLTALSAPVPGGANLLAFPAQSNFSGVEHPLTLVQDAQAAGYRVLLDAAAHAPSHLLDLARAPADYVTLSFYKMFGFPTGVGALIARHDALAVLRRPWFAGGTVEWVSVQHRAHRMKATVDAFEDGTPNFQGVAALPSGLDFLGCIGMTALRARVRSLTGRLLETIAGRSHANGRPLFEVYGPRDANARGGTIALNLVAAGGRVLPYESVECAASSRGIAVRGGCFCNPGAAEAAFRFPRTGMLERLERASAGGFTPRRLAECLPEDVPVGALRVSVGAATSERDIDRCVDALAEIALNA